MRTVQTRPESEFNWLAPDPWPIKAVATQAEAKTWLRTLIDKHRTSQT